MVEKNEKKDLASDNRSEPLSMPSRKELTLFAVFGIIPIVLIYIFASQAIDDPVGQAFEQERRLLLAACMEQFSMDEQKTRRHCRDIIDEPLVECYESLAREDGTVEDRLKLRQCITQREDDKFRLPPEEEKK